MAFYRKKIRKPGPSKNEEKVRRGEAAEAASRAAGTIATRFPGVRSLKLRLSVATPQGVVLEQSDETYGADDPFQIEANCPGSCGSGNYDFGPLIEQSLSSGSRKGTAQLVCAEASYGGGPGGTCGCVAKVDFEAA
jgi:hypothetical protein